MNNTNENLISNILLITLIIMVSLLVILTIIYLVLKVNEISKKSKLKKQDKKQENKNVKTQKTATTSYSKQSIFDFMEFDDILDNMIIQKGGKKFLMVIECQGVNYDLMSQMEKVAVEEGFQQFLNTLRHPIQIYIQTRTVNLEASINTYKDRVKQIEENFNNMQMRYNQMKESGAYTKAQLDTFFYNITKNKNLLEYGKDIVYNTEKMSLNKNVLNKKYYVVIPYYSEESDDKYSKEEIRNMAFSELYTKAQAIVRTLLACSVSGNILTSMELADLLYVSYNRDESETFGLDKVIRSGANEMYSTSMDVFEKKIKVLDREIENRAIDLANYTVSRVKSDMENQAKEKEGNIDELVEAMSKMILKENKQYIGEEIANKAIENIEKGGMGGV